MENIIYLQSKDKFDELAQLNLDTNKVSFASKCQNPALSSLSTQGFYSIVEGKMCCLYKMDKLCLSIGEERFEISNDIESVLSRKNAIHNFQLKKRGNLIFSFNYKAPILDIPLEQDMTPFIEYEDFDFLYFVNNVLKDKSRRQRIFTN